MWDFETDPEYQLKLDWVEEFMRNELEPLDLAPLDPYDKKNPELMAVLRPLQQKVKDQGLWAAHLSPELGGQGFGQVQLALLNEIVGRSRWAPSVFGSQAPDSGNAEIIALFGTEEQKQRYLQPLLDGEISSCYSMTEPQGGSDPGLFTTALPKVFAGGALCGAGLMEGIAQGAEASKVIEAFLQSRRGDRVGQRLALAILRHGHGQPRREPRPHLPERQFVAPAGLDGDRSGQLLGGRADGAERHQVRIGDDDRRHREGVGLRDAKQCHIVRSHRDGNAATVLPNRLMRPQISHIKRRRFLSP